MAHTANNFFLPSICQLDFGFKETAMNFEGTKSIKKKKAIIFQLGPACKNFQWRLIMFAYDNQNIRLYSIGFLIQYADFRSKT